MSKIKSCYQWLELKEIFCGWIIRNKQKQVIFVCLNLWHNFNTVLMYYGSFYIRILAKAERIWREWNLWKYSKLSKNKSTVKRLTNWKYAKLKLMENTDLYTHT